MSCHVFLVYVYLINMYIFIKEKYKQKIFEIHKLRSIPFISKELISGCSLILNTFGICKTQTSVEHRMSPDCRQIAEVIL